MLETSTVLSDNILTNCTLSDIPTAKYYAASRGIFRRSSFILSGLGLA